MRRDTTDMQRWTRRWCVRATAMLGTTVVWSAGTSAQGTYDVFTPRYIDVASTTVQPTGHGAGARITLIVQDSSIRSTVKVLAHQAGLRPVYDNANPIFTKRVSVHVVDANVMDAFASVLKGTGLVATIAPDGETVVIRPSKDGGSVDRSVATGILAGRVTDSARGGGLGGASVHVAGTKINTVTSDSGNFTLHDVPAGEQVISVKLFGYKPVDRSVTVIDSQRTTVRIVMVPVPTVLSGVVTTATGLQRKVEVGNDITSLNVDSVMRVAPVNTLTDLLETRVPGLTVQHTSGVPGDPSRIRIRGVSSVTGNNDPIIIIDGIRVYSSQSDPRNANQAGSVYSSGQVGTTVPITGSNVHPPSGYAAPSPLDQIDPNSIETIEVFKGPSASALYGSDAANGVIVITTKHGRAGPTQWSLDLGQGVNWLPGQWPTNYYRFGNQRAELNALNPGFSAGLSGPVYCFWYDVYCTVDSLVPFQALNDPRFTLFSHGSDQTASLSISGGVPTLQYSLSGSAARDQGNLKLDQYDQQQYQAAYGPIPSWMVRPDRYQTYGVNGQLTAQPASRIRVTLQSSLFNSTQQQGSLQSAITQLEGEYVDIVGDTLSRQNSSQASFDAQTGRTDPLIQNYVERATSATATQTNALTFHWQVTPTIPFDVTGGLNTIQRTDETYVPYGINAAGPGAAVTDTTGSYGLGRGNSQDKTLTVGTSIPLKVLTTAIGAQLTSQSTNDFSAYTNQLSPGVSVPTQFIYQNNSGPTQSTTAWSTYGWYVEPRFNINSRFFAAPGFRLDGGSASGANAGLTGYPKLDLSYVVVDPGHPSGWISLFRPRLALGVAGTQPAPTAKLRLLNIGGGQSVSLDQSTILPQVVISTLGNTHLRPETSREFEGGVDLTLWSGRFTTTVTQVNKTTFHAIIPISLAPSVYGGISQQYINVGEIRNTGTEITLNTTILENRSLSWMVGGNLSNIDNKVVKLDPGFAPNRLLGIVPGYPLFSDWARPIIGVDDINHNGIIEGGEYQVGDSAVYVGQADPKYQMNLNTTLTLLNGRLSVNATFAYQSGQTQNNLSALQSSSVAVLANAPTTTLGTQAAFVAADCQQIGFNSYQTNIAGCINTPIGLMQTVNTFRFNDLSINYTLPTSLARWLHAPRAVVMLQGSNLGLHTNYRGFDPNVNAFSTVNGGDQTADLGQLPQPRTWWLKLSLGN